MVHLPDTILVATITVGRLRTVSVGTPGQVMIVAISTYSSVTCFNARTHASQIGIGLV